MTSEVTIQRQPDGAYKATKTTDSGGKVIAGPFDTVGDAVVWIEQDDKPLSGLVEG